MLPDEFRMPPMGPEEGDGARIQGTASERQEPLSALLARHGLRADKRLGQHFLTSTRVTGAITGRLGGVRGVLEVGPGPGVLTGPISRLVEETVAIELDPRFLPVLAESAPDARVVLGDALEEPGDGFYGLLTSLPRPRAIVSNMPYNITGPLLDRICSRPELIDRAVLMMQREVGEKILAAAGDSGRGALSVVLQADYEIRRVCLVPPGAFLPPPKVESIVLEFAPRPDRIQNLEAFRSTVRAAFRQPRKTLKNNLPTVAAADFERAGVSPSLRPHELAEAQWLALCRAIDREG
ncbi:MAG: ribosomal RNA small subunit methyltransferase A [Fimbriimonadaceae bacterium]|nr:ribosomal RNA small subunit methyltransferase A [Fimbriimonadaceae bacterium]QYK57074.1 MAG: ribosomal RNA small subunit methyltransferase A [Fimbriimonadaceae bacterium]